MKYTKYVLFAILLLTSLMIVACETKENNDDINNETQEPILGGDTDEYGCIPSAGYTWCPSLNECVRVWETQCPEYEEYYQEPGMCTREYMPVTGEITIPAENGEITITKEFGNRCEAETAGATNIQLVNIEEIIVTNFEECAAITGIVMESYPEQCIYEGQLFVRELRPGELNLPENKYEACEELSGNPLEEFNECEYISQEACEYLEGEFQECESACRNDPDYPDVMCTMQCVQVCRFN